MKNLEIIKVVRIRVWFTAQEWDLYTDAEPVGARVTAQCLNEELMRCVNEGKPIDETRRFMHSIMHANSEYGANDSEPHRFLDNVLGQIYSSTNPLLEITQL